MAKPKSTSFTTPAALITTGRRGRRGAGVGRKGARLGGRAGGRRGGAGRGLGRAAGLGGLLGTELRRTVLRLQVPVDDSDAVAVRDADCELQHNLRAEAGGALGARGGLAPTRCGGAAKPEGGGPARAGRAQIPRRRACCAYCSGMRRCGYAFATLERSPCSANSCGRDGVQTPTLSLSPRWTVQSAAALARLDEGDRLVRLPAIVHRHNVVVAQQMAHPQLAFYLHARRPVGDCRLGASSAERLIRRSAPLLCRWTS